MEDEEETAERIRALLKRRFKSTVKIAADVSSAIELLDAEDFDLITLDYLLPDGNGLEILDHIRKNKGPVPVIMLTAHGESDLVESYLERGASSFVLKDEAVGTKLVTAIQMALGFNLN